MKAVATLLSMVLTCEGKLMISIGCLQAAIDINVPLHLIILRIE